jgi:hypothetical protein
VTQLVEKVRKLAATLPPAERQAVLGEVEDREEELETLRPRGGFFGFPSFPNLNEFFGDDDVDESDNDDWDE